ncbi:MAG TPA: peptide chain release factor N(5)-glutamine methyltransferase [Desulfobacteraceae bacterium]|nr:peptide chain release factor N(5)-glutamine methyltransferase [Desulfobacteraceae bacterium]
MAGETNDSWTIKSLLNWAEPYFDSHGIDSPRLTAEILLADCLGLRRLDLYLQHDRPLEQPELAGFKSLIKRRVSREPVAYITGEKGFFDAVFRVGKGVLIPRPDTEVLVENAIATLEAFDGPARILELGVGSGAIIVSLAKACPGHRFFASDLAKAPLATAQDNARRIAGDASISFFRGSWLDAVRPGAGFDLILSNPPYIPAQDILGLEPEIREHEPRLALDGGPDGLDAIRIILGQAEGCLAPGGQVMLEMGFDQKKGLTALAENFPWISDCRFIRDLAGHDRVAVVKKEID